MKSSNFVVLLICLSLFGCNRQKTGAMQEVTQRQLSNLTVGMSYEDALSEVDRWEEFQELTREHPFFADPDSHHWYNEDSTYAGVQWVDGKLQSAVFIDIDGDILVEIGDFPDDEARRRHLRSVEKFESNGAK